VQTVGSAIEPKATPAMISATIIAAVSATTIHVRRSLRLCWSPRKTWSCFKCLLAVLKIRI